MFNLTIEAALQLSITAFVSVVAGTVAASWAHRASWRMMARGSLILPLGALSLTIGVATLLGYSAFIFLGYGTHVAVALAAYVPAVVATWRLEAQRRIERSLAMKLWRNTVGGALVSALRAALGNAYTIISEFDTAPDLREPSLRAGCNISIQSRDGITLAVLQFAPDDFSLQVHYPNTAYVSYHGSFLMKKSAYSFISANDQQGAVVKDVTTSIRDFESNRTQLAAEAAASADNPR